MIHAFVCMGVPEYVLTDNMKSVVIRRDSMGHPIWQKENELRPVVFHSLRHSSTSLKLKLSKGNIKAVQGDAAHAEARMVTDTYAHGFDADRKLIAHEMDSITVDF